MEKRHTNTLTSFFDTPLGMISLKHPTTGYLFHIFTKTSKKEWKDLTKKAIDDKIYEAKQNNKKSVTHTIGDATYICKDINELVAVQKKLIKIYQDEGCTVSLDVENMKMGNIPRSANIIIKISR